MEQVVANSRISSVAGSMEVHGRTTPVFVAQSVFAIPECQALSIYRKGAPLIHERTTVPRAGNHAVVLGVQRYRSSRVRDKEFGGLRGHHIIARAKQNFVSLSNLIKLPRSLKEF